MSRHTFIWGIPRYQVKSKERWLEFAYFINLWVGAIVLYTNNLGLLDLGDREVSSIAQIAKEIYQNSFQNWIWLFPTIGGEAYLNHPPMLQSLTALAYHFFGINEFSTRIVTTSLASLSVPLLYLLAKELFLPRYYALFSALVYLTMMPVIQYSRLALSDGSLLCFYILFLLFVLKTRRDLRWSYPAGVCLSLICFSEGVLMALLVSAIALIFIYLDTPRLIFSFSTWIGTILGLLPAVSWYFAQNLYYGDKFIQENTLSSWWMVLNYNHQSIGMSLSELFKYTNPWLFFAFLGIKIAWNHRNWSWAKLILVTTIAYSFTLLLFGIKESWSIVPLYPLLSLSAGLAIGELKTLPSFQPYPSILLKFFTVSSLIVLTGFIYTLSFLHSNDNLLTVFALLFITFLTVTILLHKKDQQFISILFWGMYIILFVFFSSDYWYGELNRIYEVKPIAEIVQKVVPNDDIVYIDDPNPPASLQFYSDRQFLGINKIRIQQIWSSSLYLLIRKDTLNQINLTVKDNLYCDRLLPLKKDLSIDINCHQKITIKNSNFILLQPTKNE